MIKPTLLGNDSTPPTANSPDLLRSLFLLASVIFRTLNTVTLAQDLTYMRLSVFKDKRSRHQLPRRIKEVNLTSCLIHAGASQGYSLSLRTTFTRRYLKNMSVLCSYTEVYRFCHNTECLWIAKLLDFAFPHQLGCQLLQLQACLPLAPSSSSSSSTGWETR